MTDNKPQTPPEATNATHSDEQSPNNTNPLTEGQQPQNGKPGDTDKPERGNKGNNEAAKYRTRLRETETERDTLAAKLETAREIILNNHLAANGIALKASGIQKLGHDTADLITDDLTINGPALETALQDITNAGFTFRTRSGVVPASGTSGGPISSGAPSWADAFKA